MVIIEIGDNAKQLIDRAASALTESYTPSWIDLTFGTAIGTAMVADYKLAGGKNATIMIGLTYAGIMMQRSKFGWIFIAGVGLYYYFRHLYKQNKK